MPLDPWTLAEAQECLEGALHRVHAGSAGKEEQRLQNLINEVKRCLPPAQWPELLCALRPGAPRHTDPWVALAQLEDWLRRERAFFLAQIGCPRKAA
jgi:hypothetical protein